MALGPNEVGVDKISDCDICNSHGAARKPAQYDGKTKEGPWAFMCEAHFRTYGMGLGLGKGQKLIYTGD